MRSGRTSVVYSDLDAHYFKGCNHVRQHRRPSAIFQSCGPRWSALLQPLLVPLRLAPGLPAAYRSRSSWRCRGRVVVRGLAIGMATAAVQLYRSIAIIASVSLAAVFFCTRVRRVLFVCVFIVNKVKIFCSVPLGHTVIFADLYCCVHEHYT
jgi:hypothetical protein